MNDWESIMQRAALEHELDPDLLYSMVMAESGGKPEAVSKTGARGLLQINPITARHLGVTDPHDPEQNLNAGARYYRQLLNKFGTQDLALAAYNSGPGTVRKWGNKVPPIRETKRYLAKIRAQMSALKME